MEDQGRGREIFRIQLNLYDNRLAGPDFDCGNPSPDHCSAAIGRCDLSRACVAHLDHDDINHGINVWTQADAHPLSQICRPFEQQDHP